MDSAILSAAAALGGSLVGGMATLAASWLTQRGQLRAQTLVQEAVNRQALYAEFIIEASRRFAEAWSRQAETPEVLAGLFSCVQRFRLGSSAEVIRTAEDVVRRVVEAYAAPDSTFAELRELVRTGGGPRDLLAEFSEACRIELRDLWR